MDFKSFPFLTGKQIERPTQNIEIFVLKNEVKFILTKDDNVGVSFYAFFANKNDDPELLMEHVECYWFLERIAVGSQQ